MGRGGRAHKRSQIVRDHLEAEHAHPRRMLSLNLLPDIWNKLYTREHRLWYKWQWHLRSPKHITYFNTEHRIKSIWSCMQCSTGHWTLKSLKQTPKLTSLDWRNSKNISQTKPNIYYSFWIWEHQKILHKVNHHQKHQLLYWICSRDDHKATNSMYALTA